MKILVCGSRDWTDRETIRAWLSRFPKGSTVIEGDNGEVDKEGRAFRGADKIAGEEAAALGFIVRAYPANWRDQGRAAGPIRNQRMIDEEHVRLPLLGTRHPGLQPIDRCLAFTWALKREDRTDKLTGTGDMVSRCVEAGIVVTIGPHLLEGLNACDAEIVNVAFRELIIELRDRSEKKIRRRNR